MHSPLQPDPRDYTRVSSPERVERGCTAIFQLGQGRGERVYTDYAFSVEWFHKGGKETDEVYCIRVPRDLALSPGALFALRCPHDTGTRVRNYIADAIEHCMVHRAPSTIVRYDPRRVM